MTVNDYIEAKYGKGGVKALLACEARIFGIKYPLSRGWAFKHGGILITNEMRQSLVSTLAISKKGSAVAGLSALLNPDVKKFVVDWSKAPPCAAFWAVDASGQANWFLQPMAADGAFSCDGVVPAPDFGFSGDWRSSLIGKHGV